MTGAVLLEAKKIVKELGQGEGKVRALKGVDLGLHGGELTLLMGPSGSGKTTLLSILGCILSPTEGEVVICGSSTKGLKPEGLAKLRRTNVGFIFQDYNLFPTLSATENIRLALDVRGWPKGEQRAAAEQALIAVGLKDKINSYPSQMSGGQQQRVAIARALAGKPAVILADEPTAALDSENGQAIMALLSEIAQDPARAVLAVTHDPRTLGYADRIVLIEDGLIVREERPAKAAKATAPTPPAQPSTPSHTEAAVRPVPVEDEETPANAQPPADELSIASANDSSTTEAIAANTGTPEPAPQRQAANPSIANAKPSSRRRRSSRFARGEHLP